MNPELLQYYDQIVKHGKVDEILAVAGISKYFRERYRNAVKWASKETQKKLNHNPPSNKDL